MTKAERINPDILNDSRKKRIARGCGRTIKDINEILKRFKTMRDVMKNMGRSGMLSRMASGISNLPGVGRRGHTRHGKHDGQLHAHEHLQCAAPRVVVGPKEKKQRQAQTAKAIPKKKP